MYEDYKEAIQKHRARQCIWIKLIVITQFVSKTNIEFIKCQEIKKQEIIHTMSKFRIPSSFIYHLCTISVRKEHRYLRFVLISNSTSYTTFRRFYMKNAKFNVGKMMNRIASTYSINAAVTNFYKNCNYVK